MEKSKGGLTLDIVTNGTFDSDDIKDTIIGYGENFLAIEKYLRESTNTPESLAIGQDVPKGKIMWNENPVIGSYIGWVNTREGKHAPSWKPRTNYSVGQEIKATPDNGNIYRCVTAGRSMINTPTFNVGNGVEFHDANGYKWLPNYNYNVNDVVFAVNGSKLFYYVCETAGITNVTEPSWSSVLSGSTVIDGSVVWRKEATVKWKQVGISSEFRPFGKIE